MTGTKRGRLIPGLTALLCLAVTSSATIWAARPLYGPLSAEFHWSALLFFGTGVISLTLTGTGAARSVAIVQRFGVRTMTLLGCLASGLLLLLVLPNLTHFWQMALVMLALGGTRGMVLAGSWHELQRGLGLRLAVAAAILAVLAGLAVVTPWITQVIYRNSWREGAATCGGLLLIVASPLAYVLLPGPELERCAPDER